MNISKLRGDPSADNRVAKSFIVGLGLAAALPALTLLSGCAGAPINPTPPLGASSGLPAAPFHRELKNGNKMLVQRYIQFANRTGHTIYPQLTQPKGWVTDRMPKPIPPGGEDLPIILGCDSMGVVPDYEILYGPANPPTSGAVFKAHFNPGAYDPFAYDPDGGGGLQMTLGKHVTHGNIDITVITVEPTIASSS